jgi:hypothetical protein
MWTSLVYAAALSLAPGQAPELELTNVRATHGLLGCAREEAKYLPGDVCVVAFDITGLKMDANNKVKYSIGLEAFDPKGDLLFKQAPRELEGTCTLGGGRLPATLNLNVGLQQPPGEYKAKVTVTDLATGQSKSFTRVAEVLPRQFGLVRLHLTNDPEGRHASPLLFVGESVHLHFSVVDFARDPATKQPNLAVELRVLDEGGNPTLGKPLTGEVTQGVPAMAPDVPLHFLLSLNRPGKFTAELKATDKVSGKTATAKIPLNVQQAQ